MGTLGWIIGMAVALILGPVIVITFGLSNIQAAALGITLGVGCSMTGYIIGSDLSDRRNNVR